MQGSRKLTLCTTANKGTTFSTFAVSQVPSPYFYLHLTEVAKPFFNLQVDMKLNLENYLKHKGQKL
jgi:hypothetical protein